MIVFKIPFGSGSLGKSNGTENAPEKIISKAKEFTSTEEGKLFDIIDRDIQLDNKNISESLKIIENTIKELPFVCLGGDHTITYSIMKKIAHKNLGIIIFDAHPDLMQRFSVPTHENYLRHLIEEKIIDTDQIVLIGLRNIDPEEKKFLDKNKINYFTLHEICQEGVQDICDSVMEFMNKFKQMYISVDIDAVDPAFAPGVAYPEVGGLTSREMLYFLRRLMMMKNFSGGDIIEVIPEKDISEITINLAARILAEMSRK